MALTARYRLYLQPLPDSDPDRWDELARISDAALGLPVDALANDIILDSLRSASPGAVAEVRLADGVTVVSRIVKVGGW